MFRPLMTAAAVILGLAASVSVQCQILDRWFVREIYSNDDGSVQFVKIEIDFDMDPQNQLIGKTLVASSGSLTRSFTFTRFIDCVLCTGGDLSSFIVGTQGFVDLQPGVADFVVPNGFLFIPAGTLKMDTTDEVHYAALPTDGTHALYPHGFAWDDRLPDAPITGTPIAHGVFMPGKNAIIEFRNDALDDYFLTAYPTEIEMLDSAPSSGWQRTGLTFTAWTAAFSVKAGETQPSNLLPVCRVWLGNSHFYSILATECADVAKYSAYLETPAAFFAALPDAATGACPADETPVYRLWNPRGSDHRYTAEPAVRDEMQARGYIAEGYGPAPVAMCVAGM